jgi:hypothetical protein
MDGGIAESRFLLMAGSSLTWRKQIVEQHFNVISGEEDWSPRYNIAPTQPVPFIRQNPKEPVREPLDRWGNMKLCSIGTARSESRKSELNSKQFSSGKLRKRTVRNLFTNLIRLTSEFEACGLR